MTSSPYLVGLVGQGVGPSLTPELHMAEGRAHGLDYVYRTIDLDAIGVPPERIGEVLSWARALGFNALNITHPCKRLVIPHLDALDHDAAALGAVNTVVFEENAVIGYNTDAPGFAHGLYRGHARRSHQERRAARRRRRRGGRRTCAARPRYRAPHRRRPRRRPSGGTGR